MSRTAWDRHLSIFSPEGRLYQVEYAFKAVKGPALTSVGIRGENCVVACTIRKVPDKLLKRETVQHIFPVNKNIGCVITGRIADGKSLLFRARQIASEFHYDNGFDIPPSYLAKRMADIYHINTQYGGLRPLGATLIIFGMELMDSGEYQPTIYKVDPAGFNVGYFGTAAGQKEIEAMNHLEKKHRNKPLPTLSEEEATTLAISTLQTVLGADFKAPELEVAVMSTESRAFKLLDETKVDSFLTKIAERD
eukprot:TRINITY_DN104605_c0_g1_i1.p1 TRINITY_DN104605_c0_g1~~TRINITY_DN104605_c0_g1_i1.p1  ORF type:complete len:250 (-),score=33.27 TRINITY_DN104605_c0_g1_i1:87-836(-)